MEKITKWLCGAGAAASGAFPRAQQGLQNCNGVCGNCGGGCAYGIVLAFGIVLLYVFKRLVGINMCHEK